MRKQNVFYERLTTFFLPLMVILIPPGKKQKQKQSTSKKGKEINYGIPPQCS